MAIPDLDTDRINVVLGTQRSGTTAFRALLEEAGCRNFGEVMHHDLEAKNPRFYRFLRTALKNDPSFIYPRKHRRVFKLFVDSLLERAPGPIVIDIKQDTLGLIPHETLTPERPWLVDFLRANARKIYFIRRRDTLRRYVSLAMSKETGIWGMTKKMSRETLEKPRLTLDPSRVRADLTRMVEYDDMVASWLSGAPNVVPIAYEGMFAPDGGFAPDVVAAATLPGRPAPSPEPRHKRLNPETLDELVDNMGAVRKALRGSPFAEFAEV